jgi:hypothetical protein
MRADIHDGPEHHTLQSEAGYIDARPKGRIQKRKTNYLQIITFGLQRTAGPYKSAILRCAVEIPRASVSWMNSVVEIDAGKDGKHVSLQERDQKFERGQRNRQRER